MKAVIMAGGRGTRIAALAGDFRELYAAAAHIPTPSVPC